MTNLPLMNFDEIESLAFKALVAAGTTEDNARTLAHATAATEYDGISSHGLAYIPIYCEHVRCGKVDGKAAPVLTRPAPSVINVDAATGFAHPAIDLGFQSLISLAKEQGVAALSIKNSYNCGVLGYHTRRLAENGLLAIGFTNSPASIAPVGGRKPLVGTNPFSLAAPDEHGGAMVLIDQSASVIAKSEVMKHARENRPIPVGWALDVEGQPTTDPELALKGSMAPAGGYKGVGIALMVEIMAAAMTGATLGKDASPFSGTKGGPPKTGQFFLAINPNVTSNNAFAGQLKALVDAMHNEPGVRVPGDGRKAAQTRVQASGVEVNPAIIEKIQAWLD